MEKPRLSCLNGYQILVAVAAKGHRREWRVGNKNEELANAWELRDLVKDCSHLN